MSRARQFDPQVALDKAMEVFWQKGYVGTSIDDLVAATGVSRYGLYDEFEGKRGLFLACLDHYQEIVVSAAFGVVERPGASVSEIRAYFGKILEAPTSKRGRRGCLMTNTASEVAPYDKRAAGRVEDFRARLRSGFSRALATAQTQGEIHAELPVSEVADFLTAVTHGLSVLARSHADPGMMANVVATALSCLA